MKDVKEIVLKQHTNLMNSRGVNKQSSEDMTFGRDDAIDSIRNSRVYFRCRRRIGNRIGWLFTEN